MLNIKKLLYYLYIIMFCFSKICQSKKTKVSTDPLDCSMHNDYNPQEKKHSQISIVRLEKENKNRQRDNK